MKRIYKVIVLLILLLFYYLVFIKNISIPCLFKSAFHISCPMCGLTRSILALLSFNIGLSFYYNVFGIVVFMLFIVFILLLLFDIIFNKNKIELFFNKIGRFYIVIIVMLMVSMIINNIRGI